MLRGRKDGEASALQGDVSGESCTRASCHMEGLRVGAKLYCSGFPSAVHRALAEVPLAHTVLLTVIMTDRHMTNGIIRTGFCNQYKNIGG